MFFHQKTDWDEKRLPHSRLTSLAGGPLCSSLSIFLLRVVEALAEHFGRTQHRHKGVQVFLMDEVLQLVRLVAGQGR